MRNMFAVVFIFFGGCASFGTLSAESDYDTLIKNQEYEKALQHIELETIHAGETAESKDRKKQVKQLIRDFEKETVLKASKEEDAGNLANALEILGAALKKVPSNQRLNEIYKSVEAERDIRLTRTEHRLLLAQARYLLEKKELSMEKNRVQGSRFFDWWKRQQTESNLPKISQQLLECGEQAMQRQEMKLAGECLLVSKDNDDNKKVQDLLEKWRKAQDTHLSAQQNNSQQQRLNDIKKLRAALQISLAESDFAGAQTSITSLQEMNGMTPELEQLIDEKVQHLLNQGNRLYRSGEIKDAAEIWHNVLLLTPNNAEAAAHLERAEKILKRIQELSKE